MSKFLTWVQWAAQYFQSLKSGYHKGQVPLNLLMLTSFQALWFYFFLGKVTTGGKRADYVWTIDLMFSLKAYKVFQIACMANNNNLQ